MKLVVLSVAALLVCGVLRQETETKTSASVQAQRPLPTAEPEKRALAEWITAHYESLDDAERSQLKELAPYAFPLLLARYIAWTKTYDVTWQDVGSSQLSHLLENAQPLLRATYRKEDLTAVARALESLDGKSLGRDAVANLLIAREVPARYIPVFVRNLRCCPAHEDRGSELFATVVQSSRPEAVAFMLETLRNPKAEPMQRQSAFIHLPVTGGTVGVLAVLAARNRPGPRKPWFDTIDCAHLDPTAILGIKMDARGRTWMLFHSLVLGNRGDLFLVQKIGKRWGKPLFTGVCTERSFPPNKTFRGIPMAELVATEWIKIFPDDPAIRQDTDGDGLTDLVEARLGTDPHKADTDGDGLSDLVDPCPNAAPRPLGDTEKIIGACIDARFFGDVSDCPAVIDVEDVQPFQIYGYSSTLLWFIPGTQASRQPILYSDLFDDRGLLQIGFSSPAEAGSHEKSVIQYDADHQTAHTRIHCSTGLMEADEMEATLRKIGEEWFVIALEMRSVS